MRGKREAMETVSVSRKRERSPLKSRSLSPSPPPPTPETMEKSAAAATTTGYEKCREQRIKDNLERMQKLGLLDLSLQVKNLTPNSSPNPKRRRLAASPAAVVMKNPNPNPNPNPSLPPRRSSRLQNVAPVSYVDMNLKKSGDSDKRDDSSLVREGSREEIYTEEHEKFLGSCGTHWELFVDGYGKDGRRIYDPAKGKTCHQCRQKTLGQRTSCCKCKLVQGQFCGDCLYMRYGENVLEANKNPNWTCPVCRGICNCSLCRIKNGWNPTGPLYKRISSLGYKSVAHYLIQTRRSTTDNDNNNNSADVNCEENSSKSNSKSETEEKSSKSKSESETKEKSSKTNNRVKSKSETKEKSSNSSEVGSVVVVPSSSDESNSGNNGNNQREVTSPATYFLPGPVSSRLRMRPNKSMK